ncbi:peptidoglycan-binding protein [Marinococcus halotolerans]|uniref:peptidoglycan-binding protein n=1 Tax=Marinococcus halotolerans TaxID=301092 RepID=UPI0003B6844A|nr:peptidoglycan-binding protein [Marinococcus halotolerans]
MFKPGKFLLFSTVVGSASLYLWQAGPSEVQAYNYDSLPLSEPSSGEDVLQLQQDLNEAGFHVTDNPTDYFGPLTESAVEDFQRANGLDVTGEAGTQTIDVLSNELADGFRRGDSDAAVQAYQEGLNTAGFHVTDSPTTYFGPKTQEAVEDFQQAYNIQISGMLDAETVEALEYAASSPESFQNGDRHKDVQRLQEQLNEAGFHVTDNPTMYFGPRTEAALKDFQKSAGLSADGIAGESTLQLLEQDAEGYANGMEHEDIQTYQQMLNDAGFHVTDEPTTYFGPLTEQAVKDFQQSYSLPVTGILDDETIKVLETASEPPEVLENGVRHASVQELQQLLNDAGFHVTDNTTNYFGPKTEEALREFQQLYGLEETGTADSETMETLEAYIDQTENALERGDSGEGVEEMQTSLNALGYNAKEDPDGSFDDSTEEALQKFQTEQGIPATGIYDSVTEETLEELAAESFPSPFEHELQEGDAGDDVQLLKQHLTAAGFETNSGDSFDSDMTARVEEYQEEQELAVTGTADAATLTSLLEMESKTYDFYGKDQNGHGVGMTQWGAYGMAQEGNSYEEILKYYYTDIDVTTSSDYQNRDIRVLLGETDQNSATIESGESYDIVDADGEPVLEDLEGTTEISYGSDGSGEFVITNGETVATTEKAISTEGDGTFQYEGTEYRGSLQFKKSDIDGIQSSWVMDVVNHVDIDDYLEGVVPYEMYSSWDEPEAFKVQAVAARAYAFTQASPESNFDVYDDTRSQVYHGIPTGPQDKSMILDAIHDTSGTVLTYDGQLVEGIYSASASGHTEDAENVWGSEFDYLTGVEDPYDGSSYAQVSWEESFSTGDISSMEYFQEEEKGDVLALRPVMENERLQEMNVVMEEETITLSGDQFRSAVDSNEMDSNIMRIEEKE